MYGGARSNRPPYSCVPSGAFSVRIAWFVYCLLSEGGSKLCERVLLHMGGGAVRNFLFFSFARAASETRFYVAPRRLRAARKMMRRRRNFFQKTSYFGVHK